MVVPDATLHQIFLNIKQIHQFNETLLSDLRVTLEDW